MKKIAQNDFLKKLSSSKAFGHFFNFKLFLLLTAFQKIGTSNLNLNEMEKCNIFF